MTNTKLVILTISVLISAVVLHAIPTAYAKLDHKTFEKCFHNPRIIDQDVANALSDRTKTFLERDAVEYNATIPNPNNAIDSAAYPLITRIHVCMVEGGE